MIMTQTENKIKQICIYFSEYETAKQFNIFSCDLSDNAPRNVIYVHHKLQMIRLYRLPGH